MLRYPTVITEKLKLSARRSYPRSRPDFRPPAYVVLTREMGVRTGEFRWLSSLSASSMPPSPARKTTSSGMTNYQVLASASSLPASAATSSSIVGRPLAPLHHRLARRLDAGARTTGGEDSVGPGCQGDNPAEERQLDHKAITVKELCDLYFTDLKAGLILGKGGRPEEADNRSSPTPAASSGISSRSSARAA